MEADARSSRRYVIRVRTKAGTAGLRYLRQHRPIMFCLSWCWHRRRWRRHLALHRFPDSGEIPDRGQVARPESCSAQAWQPQMCSWAMQRYVALAAAVTIGQVPLHDRNGLHLASPPARSTFDSRFQLSTSIGPAFLRSCMPVTCFSAWPYGNSSGAVEIFSVLELFSYLHNLSIERK